MPPFSPEIRHEIWKEKASKCEVCGEDAESIHHQVPESYGGKSIKENGILVCHIDHAVLDHLVLDMAITPLGPLNEIPDEFFRNGNPFKNITPEQLHTMKHDDLASVANKHKRKKSK